MLYAFQCPKRHQFDRILPIYRRDEEVRCPECGSIAARQHCSISHVEVDMGKPDWANAWKDGKAV
jgi:uncharacterized C2H2 Zn-finger protein